MSLEGNSTGLCSRREEKGESGKTSSHIEQIRRKRCPGRVWLDSFELMGRNVNRLTGS
jgi:hypothetical protein